VLVCWEEKHLCGLILEILKEAKESEGDARRLQQPRKVKTAKVWNMNDVLGSYGRGEVIYSISNWSI